MSAESIPDLAARLHARSSSLQSQIDELKSAGAEWTTQHGLRQDIVDQAREGLVRALQLLDRQEQLVRQAVAHARKPSKERV